MIHYRTEHLIRAEDDESGDKPLRFVVATEGRKADGLDLRMDNVDLDRFRANPRVFWMHDWSESIGRGDNIEVADGRLLSDAIFDLDHPRGAQADRQYRGGFLDAVSVGFDLHDVDDAGVPARWEPLEFSAVTVPLDADAVLDSGRQARAMVDALAGLRAGKTLSAANAALVEQAVAALSKLLEAAGGEQSADPAVERGTPAGGLSLAAARLRLEHMEMLAGV